MHFKIKVSIYLDKEAREETCNPTEQHGSPAGPPAPSPVLPPPTSQLPSAAAGAPSGFKSSSRGTGKPQVQRASWQGDRTPREGWKRAEIHRRGRSAQEDKNSKGFQNLISIRTARADQKVWGSNWEGCVSAAQMPGLQRGSGFLSTRLDFRSRAAIKVSIRLISSLPPQGSRISPTNKAVCDSEHFWELKHSAFYKSAPELS